MSVYDNRLIAAYQGGGDPAFANNRHILEWWSPALDQVIAREIERWKWQWPWKITDALLKEIPEDTIKQWRRRDSKCRRYNWQNVLMHFAMGRAMVIGLHRTWNRVERTCPLCGNDFCEQSIPMPLVERLTIDQLDFCAPCLSEKLFNRENNNASADEIIAYAKRLSSFTGHIPAQGFAESTKVLHGMTTAERLELLGIIGDRPSPLAIKRHFGSWLKVLIEAGLLVGESRMTARGIQTLARDGHLCLSLGERTIDDALHRLGIPHDREPRYPVGQYRGDFLVAGKFIEYLGLDGNPDYDAKVRVKKKIAKDHNLSVLWLRPLDLTNLRRLEAKLVALTD